MKIATKTLTDNGIRFQFVDGKTVDVDMSQFDSGIIQRATIHGLSQKLGDSYAAAQNTAEAHEKFDATLKGLLSGQWTTARTSGSSILISAVAEATGESAEEAARVVAGMDKDEVAKVKKNARVAAILARYDAERKAKKAEAAAAALTEDDYTSLTDLIGG